MFDVKLKISKEQRTEWQRYCDELQRLEPSSLAFESEDDKAVRKERLLSVGHYDEWTQYYFQKVTRGTHNAQFQNKIADDILEADKFRGCLKIARGHAKTSHNGLINLLRLKALGKVKFVLIVGKSQNDAVRTLSKLQAHLQYNKRYIADFGEQVKDGDWAEGEFSTIDGVKFMAIGRGQSPRGLNSDDSFRPDYILLDDIDDDELCRNPSRVSDLIEWIYDALINAMDMGRGRFVVIGNLISKNSVVQHFSEKKSMYHIQVNVIDENGDVAWKEKYTLAEVNDWIDFLGYRSAQKELFNNPIVVGKVFKKDNIIYGKIPPIHTLDSIVSYTDPAAVNTKTSCFKSTVILGFKGRYIYLIDVYNENSSMLKMITWIYDKYEVFVNKEINVDWWMESGFAQYLYINDFDHEGERRGYFVPILPDNRQKPNKHARIESLATNFERHEFIFNEDLFDTPHMKAAEEHLLAFEKGCSTPLDFPDALEGGTVKGRVKLIFSKFNAKFGERPEPNGIY